MIRGGERPVPDRDRDDGAVTGGKGGDVVTSDGPYAETKEALTGFYLLECADLDEAVNLRREDPGGLERRRRGPPGHRVLTVATESLDRDRRCAVTRTRSLTGWSATRGPACWPP